METITISRAEYEELKGQNEWLKEQLRLLRKKQFGTSSEQSKAQLDDQLSLLFNEAETYAAPPGVQKTTQVAAHTRKQSGSVKDVVPDNIPVEVVEHRLSAVIYSLIETAKETGLDPFRYLTWVLQTVPTLDRTVEGWAVLLLPANAPEPCVTT